MGKTKGWDELEEQDDSEEQLPPDFANPKAPDPVSSLRSAPAPRLYQPEELDEDGSIKVEDDAEWAADHDGSMKEASDKAESESG